MHPSFESDASRGLCASRDHLEDAQSSAGGAAEAPEPIRAQERATTFQKKTHKTQRPLNSFPFSIPFWLDAIAPPCTLQYISVVLIPHLDTVERLYSHTKRFPSLQPNSCAVPEGSQDQPEPFPTLH